MVGYIQGTENSARYIQSVYTNSQKCEIHKYESYTITVDLCDYGQFIQSPTLASSYVKCIRWKYHRI